MSYLLGIKSSTGSSKKKEETAEKKPVCLLCLPKEKWSVSISNKKKAK